MARALRKFARGGLTIDEFEQIAEPLGDRDPAAADAAMFAWYFYSDFGTDHATASLTSEERRIWAKWVLFLMADDEAYAGPSLAPDGGVILVRLLSIALTQAAFWAHLYESGLELFLSTMFSLDTWLYEQAWRLAGRNDPPLADYWPFPSQVAFGKAIQLSNPFASQT